MITLKTNNYSMIGWKEIHVEKCIDLLSGKVELHSDLLRNTVDFIPQGSLCELYDGNTKVSTFYADRVKKTVSGSGRYLNIWGREKTCDLVDCNFTPVWEWKNVTVLKIVTDLTTPFGITVKCDVTTPSLPSFRANYGETLANIIGDLMHRSGLRIRTDVAGSLVIEPDGHVKGATDYEHGVNLFFCSTYTEGFQSYSKYVVRGQQVGIDGMLCDAPAQVESIVTGSGRYRPLLVLPEGSINEATAKVMGEWENSVRALRSKKFIMCLSNWAEVELNRKMFCSSKELGVKAYHSISSLSLTLEAGVQRSVITLQESIQ